MSLAFLFGGKKGPRDAEAYRRTLPLGATTAHSLECISTPPHQQLQILNFATLRQSERKKKSLKICTFCLRM